MRAYIELDSKKLEDNYDEILNKTKKDIIAVVKSNAYGHGLIEICRILQKKQPKMFAVSTLEEAILIRKNLIFTPILLLCKEDDYRAIYNYKLTASIISMENLKALARTPFPLICHLCIDTGLNRDGILPSQLGEALEIIKNSRLILKGVYTHYSSLKEFNYQHDIFAKVLNQIPKKNLIIHSQATSTMMEDCQDCNTIRIGLALYGLDKKNNCKPILTLKAPIIRINRVLKGTKVGYDESEATKSDGFLLTCAIGYADGLSRNEKYLGYVDNFYVPQIGYIFMDHIIFFSLKIPKDNFVELIGEHISTLDIANFHNTIPYEIIAHLATRIKRFVI